MKLLHKVSGITLLLLLAGCSTATQPTASSVECTEPRLQMCAEIYQPVCAKRDTGVRCVTTPCASTEWVTKSNACSACADKKVYGFVNNGCPVNDK